METIKNLFDFLKTLNWSDLEAWAGPRIVARGKSYQRSDLVNDLALSPSGELIAWVEGTDRYATKVAVKDKKISSSCTCPYGIDCKHAVAVVLESLKFLKNKKEIPLTKDEDSRIGLFEKHHINRYNEIGSPQSVQKTYSGPFLPPKTPQSLRAFLKQRTKKELIESLLSITRRHPEIKAELHDEADLVTGKIEDLVKSISRDIDEISAEPAWWNEWKSQGEIPDYSRILNNLQNLLDEGYTDEVVTLGKKLYKSGQEQISISDDKGQTASQIIECLTVMFKALRFCSMPDSEKILTAFDFKLEDEYDLCWGMEEFWKETFSKKDWSSAADELLDRLHKGKLKDDKYVYVREYKRNGLTNAIIHALKKAGRNKEIIPLAMKEAEKTTSYERLVKFLLQESRVKEAEDWIRKGFAATIEKLPGIAHHLREHLYEIRSKARDFMFAAAIRAEEFFESPSLSCYIELQKISEKAGVWPEVRLAALAFLEKGKKPEIKENSHKDSKGKAWPLPSTGLELNVFRHKFPLARDLIEIAVYEKKVDDVLHWHEIIVQNNPIYGTSGEENIHDKVAGAIIGRYPDKAISIWKKLADSHISRTKPSEYIRAAKYIGKVKKYLQKAGRSKEWVTYLAKLRLENARKRRLLEILEDLSGKPIIDQ
ncbi:MAG: SWIM zinc finger domain-containing protein [Candidatus Aminicenantes bacterium]|nr:SWIM zinc finger domain-containing protein [Candidatus Aminicenantes bacterium]